MMTAEQKAENPPAKNLNFYLHSICKFFSLIFICALFMNCSTKTPLEQTVIIVKVPPFYDNNLSREENYWRFQKFLYPQQETPNPIPKGMPNDNSVLFVSVNQDGKIQLNQQKIGSVSDTNFLRSYLAHIFSEREHNGMYEPGNWKIVKAVGIKADNSVKYDDFIKVVEAVKQSGAEPIVLLFNDDTKPKPQIDL